jgi:toxin ParE1/3/4
MARYRLSAHADDKISAIYKYSLLNFGEDQADLYFTGLHRLLGTLAETPLLGRSDESHGNGLRRFVYERHVIFYKVVPGGILVLDVFGVRQVPRTPGKI